MDKREAIELFAYNDWANDRIMEACSALDADALERDLGGSFGSVIATLAHILAAEWVWLERWEGRSPTGLAEHWDLSDLEGIRSRWIEVRQRRGAWLDALDESALAAEIDYRTTAGVPYRSVLWRLCRHVVNHGTYHRGQVVHGLRTLGVAGVSTDFVLYDRTVGG